MLFLGDRCDFGGEIGFFLLDTLTEQQTGHAGDFDRRADDRMQIVDREHMAVGDISVAAQVARIKAANPDVLLIWVIGPPTATVLHGLIDAGVTTPIILSSGDLVPAFLNQYGSLLPKDTYISAMAYYAGNVLTDRSTVGRLSEMTNALRSGVRRVRTLSASANGATMPNSCCRSCRLRRPAGTRSRRSCMGSAGGSSC